MSNEIYTRSEREDKKYTVGQALASAERRLKSRKVCVNAISGRALTEKITLKELNELAQEMVNDTYYYDGEPS